ncbi:MAG: cysteine--tRNA ligase [Candidatus Bilamarchaeaceae archaeon]
MKIYNSLSRKIEPFEPVEEGKAYLYVCGLTPYDHAHLGHARTYIAMDFLKRYLIYKGFQVLHIQNITDIEDKIFKRSRETGISPLELSKKFHTEALEEFAKLNILPANHYPAVSGHIPEIIEMISSIVAAGHAYETPTGVYFDVNSFPGYGKLSGQKIEEVNRGARIDVDETKKDPADFALWKKGEDVLTFDSPWGIGRPGWHIECSAMSLKYTKGRTLDIHGGGRDLIFPHHENEIAQAEAANGSQFSKYWVHTGFLTVNGEKMSKSLGNFIVLKDLLKKHPPYALRLFFLQSHYRSPVDYSEGAIEAAGKSAEKIFNFLERASELPERGGNPEMEFRRKLAEEKRLFFSALDNDLDTPKAISHLFALISACFSNMQQDEPDFEELRNAREDVSKMAWIFGLRKEERRRISEQMERQINALVAEREKARKEKNFKRSDEIRSQLAQMGIILEDTAKGPKWKYKG